MSPSPLFLGIISGQRRRVHAEVNDRAARIAGGLHRLGVKPGDSVCILMRNDTAFIEAAYAAMRLGAYAVPVNWHFKPEEINYVLKDSGTSALIGSDIGYLDEDGYVFICDRKRDMVISGGVNIYPAEIEAALHAVPGVHDCAVFGIPDDEFGEALMAVVEPQAGVTLDVAVIRAQLKTSLADYKVPKHVEIHADLPREDSGKIFKRRLRDPYWERAGRRI
jgi:acyl-CoA synthetase (AMP-forming)/AMP-acid ligase II